MKEIKSLPSYFKRHGEGYYVDNVYITNGVFIIKKEIIETLPTNKDLIKKPSMHHIFPQISKCVLFYRTSLLHDDGRDIMRSFKSKCGLEEFLNEKYVQFFGLFELWGEGGRKPLCDLEQSFAISPMKRPYDDDFIQHQSGGYV